MRDIIFQKVICFFYFLILLLPSLVNAGDNKFRFHPNNHQCQKCTKFDNKQRCTQWSNQKGMNPNFFGECGDKTGANLQGISRPSEFSLKKAKLVGTNLSSAQLPKADFDSADLQTVNLESAKLQGADIGYVNLRNANLKKVNLSGSQNRHNFGFGAHLDNADLSEGQLRYIIFSQASFTRATLNKANFSYALIDKANFSDSKGEDVNFSYVGSWSNYYAPVFSRAKLPRSRWLGAKLEAARFNSADLEGADFQNADLRSSDFTNTNLVGANLQGANVQGTIFQNAKYDNSTQFPSGFDPVSHGMVKIDPPPVALDQSVTTQEDTEIAITLSGSDPENNSLTYTIVTQPTKGTLTGIPPTVTYTPNSNYSGADSFTFKAYDGEKYSAPATVSITVNEIKETLQVESTPPGAVTTVVINNASFAEAITPFTLSDRLQKGQNLSLTLKLSRYQTRTISIKLKPGENNYSFPLTPLSEAQTLLPDCKAAFSGSASSPTARFSVDDAVQAIKLESRCNPETGVIGWFEWNQNCGPGICSQPGGAPAVPYARLPIFDGLKIEVAAFNTIPSFQGLSDDLFFHYNDGKQLISVPLINKANFDWETSHFPIPFSGPVQTTISFPDKKLAWKCGVPGGENNPCYLGATLQINTTPSDAWVELHVDGILEKQHSGSDAIFRNLYPDSMTKVLVRSNKYITKVIEPVALESNKKTVLSVSLDPKPGRLSVQAKHAETQQVLTGVTVKVDGVEKGVTPLTLNSIPAGTYTINLFKEGFDPAPHHESIPVTVSSEETTYVTGLLKPRPFPSKIIVKTTPPEVNVTIRGGATQEIVASGIAALGSDALYGYFTAENLQAGNYVVTAQKKYYEPVSQPVQNLQAGVVRPVPIQMQRKCGGHDGCPLGFIQALYDYRKEGWFGFKSPNQTSLCTQACAPVCGTWLNVYEMERWLSGNTEDRIINCLDYDPIIVVSDEKFAGVMEYYYTQEQIEQQIEMLEIGLEDFKAIVSTLQSGGTHERIIESITTAKRFYQLKLSSIEYEKLKDRQNTDWWLGVREAASDDEANSLRRLFGVACRNHDCSTYEDIMMAVNATRSQMDDIARGILKNMPWLEYSYNFSPEDLLKEEIIRSDMRSYFEPELAKQENLIKDYKAFNNYLECPSPQNEYVKNKLDDLMVMLPDLPKKEVKEDDPKKFAALQYNILIDSIKDRRESQVLRNFNDEVAKTVLTTSAQLLFWSVAFPKIIASLPQIAKTVATFSKLEKLRKYAEEFKVAQSLLRGVGSTTQITLTVLTTLLTAGQFVFTATSFMDFLNYCEGLAINNETGITPGYIQNYSACLSAAAWSVANVYFTAAIFKNLALQQKVGQELEKPSNSQTLGFANKFKQELKGIVDDQCAADCVSEHVFLRAVSPDGQVRSMTMAEFSYHWKRDKNWKLKLGDDLVVAVEELQATILKKGDLIFFTTKYITLDGNAHFVTTAITPDHLVQIYRNGQQQFIPARNLTPEDKIVIPLNGADGLTGNLADIVPNSLVVKEGEGIVVYLPKLRKLPQEQCGNNDAIYAFEKYSPNLQNPPQSSPIAGVTRTSKQIVYKKSGEFFQRLQRMEQDLRGHIEDLVTKLSMTPTGVHPSGSHYVREGVWELTSNSPSGPRVYYARSGKDAYVVLLCGTKAQQQQRDIPEAIRLWKEYQNGSN